MLEYPAAQMKVTERLHSRLFDKCDHAYKYKIEHDESIPFHKFCDWIMRQAKEGSNTDF